LTGSGTCGGLHRSGGERIVYEGTESQAWRLVEGNALGNAFQPQHRTEESFKLKRKLLLSILAVVPAALMPLAATSQVASPRESATVDQGEPNYRYEVFAGYGYTSLNQLNESRSGLQGVNVSITRDWGKYFGVTADGAYYKYAIVSGNPGHPSVDTVLFGPVFHANLYGRTSGFFHGLIGGEHTGGESMTPNISFAGGVGGGLEYKLSQHFALRASGDYIGASFSVSGNSANLGYSPHRTWDSRAAFGAVYRF
jgi:hypothetical protein